MNAENNSNFESKYFISRKLPPLAIEFQDAEHQLILRPFSPEDVQKFEQSLQKTLPSLYKFMPWPIKKWDQHDCLLWLTERHGEYFLGKVFEWGCFDQKTGDFLLTIGIMPAPSWSPDCWEIGYWTVVDHTQKGLATLANKIVIAIAFQCFHIKRLQVGCMKENKASRRVIEKAGFQFEGEFRGLFSPPSKEQIELGAILATSDLYYALLPDDCHHLPWYESILRSTHVLSVAHKKFLLSELV